MQRNLVFFIYLDQIHSALSDLKKFNFGQFTPEAFYPYSTNVGFR